jgi:phage recombination protein Bet
MQGTEIQRYETATHLEFSSEQRQMIRDTFANGATDAEFAVLLEVSKARRLNPLLRQIHFVKRYDSVKRREVWATQVSIDGLRAIAERTKLYDGQDEPEFEYDAKGGIKLARVKVYRKDWGRPAVGVARWEEYVQTTKEGGPTRFWRQMAHVMLGKCAEALALRKAFPEDMAGLYTPEEMAQADNPRELKREQIKQLKATEPEPEPEPENAEDPEPYFASIASVKSQPELDAIATALNKSRASFASQDYADLREAWAAKRDDLRRAQRKQPEPEREPGDDTAEAS